MITPPKDYEYDPRVQDVMELDEAISGDLKVYSTYQDELISGALQSFNYGRRAARGGVHTRQPGEVVPDSVMQYSLAARFGRLAALTEVDRPDGFAAEFFMHEEVSQNDRFAPPVLAEALRVVAGIAERRTPGVSIGIVKEAALRDSADVDDLEPYHMTETTAPLRKLWLNDLAVRVDRRQPPFQRVVAWRSTLGAIALPPDATISFLHNEARRLDRV